MPEMPEVEEANETAFRNPNHPIGAYELGLAGLAYPPHGQYYESWHLGITQLDLLRYLLATQLGIRHISILPSR